MALPPERHHVYEPPKEPGDSHAVTRRDALILARDVALGLIALGGLIGLSDLWTLLTANHDIETNGYPLYEVLVGETTIQLDQINIRTAPLIPPPDSGTNTAGYGEVQGANNKPNVKVSNALVVKGTEANPDGSSNPNLWLVLPRVGGGFLFVGFNGETSDFINTADAEVDKITNASTSDKKHETVTLADGKILKASQLSVVTPA